MGKSVKTPITYIFVNSNGDKALETLLIAILADRQRRCGSRNGGVKGG